MDFPKSVPSIGLVDGKFVDEDQVAGTPGSLIPAQWGNSVTEELLNVIASAGLTPDEDNDAQLLLAINAKIADAIPASPPDASTVAKGLVELATDAETQIGTDTQRAVTPAGLAARTATETRGGIIELATSAEVQAGVDAARAITPATLGTLTATDTRAGVVELATNAETRVGTDTQRAITAAALASCTASETQVGLARIATQFEVNLGASDFVFITPAKLKAWSENWLFTAEFPLSPGTANTITFPANKIPTSFDVRYKCTGGAGTAGYSNGDEVDISSWLYNSLSTANNAGPYLHSFTTSGCVLMQASGASSFFPHKTTGAVTAITAASFSIVVRMTS